MSGLSFKLDIRELVDFGNNLENGSRTEYVRRIIEMEANTLLQRLIRNTPVDTGNLRKHWTADNPTIIVENAMGGYKVTLVNKAADEKGRMYGSWVDQGHKAIPGQFIPPLGKSIRKTTTWVQGRFFVDKSIRQMNDNDLKRIVKDQLQAWLEGCLQ